jgi:hypothetical protein
MTNDTLLQEWYASIDIRDLDDSIELRQSELSEHPKLIIIEKHSIVEFIQILLNYVK